MNIKSTKDKQGQLSIEAITNVCEEIAKLMIPQINKFQLDYRQRKTLGS
jgi:hypothetical protein